MNDAVQSVHLGGDGLAGNQIGEKLFRFLDRQVKESRHPLHRHTGVVLGHNADIVLDNAGLEGLPAFLTFLGTCCQIISTRLRLLNKKMDCQFKLTDGEDVSCWCGSVSHSKDLFILLAESTPVDEFSSDKQLQQFPGTHKLIRLRQQLHSMTFRWVTCIWGFRRRLSPGGTGE